MDASMWHESDSRLERIPFLKKNQGLQVEHRSYNDITRHHHDLICHYICHYNYTL